MPAAYIDATGGVTGDMWLGALIDAGASLDTVQQAVDTLGIGGVRVAYARVVRGGEGACLIRLRAPTQTPVVRRWQEIERLLQYAALNDTVRKRATSTLRRIAEVEADRDGCQVDDAEFHEFAALTMLADVIGACAAINELELDELAISPVATGFGELETVNGPLELPDERAAALLHDFPTVAGPGPDKEITTVVGAALVAEFCHPATAAEPPTQGATTGIGAGHHDTRLVLRAG